MSDYPPHPDAGAGETPTRREVTLRESETERTWVKWFAGAPGGSLTSIMDEQDGDEERVLSFEANELQRLLEVLREAERELADATPGAGVVRDLGFERVSVEWDGGFVTFKLKSVSGLERMLVLAESEVGDLLDAVERSRDEQPAVDGGAYGV